MHLFSSARARAAGFVSCCTLTADDGETVNVCGEPIIAASLRPSAPHQLIVGRICEGQEGSAPKPHRPATTQEEHGGGGKIHELTPSSLRLDSLVRIPSAGTMRCFFDGRYALRRRAVSRQGREGRGAHGTLPAGLRANWKNNVASSGPVALHFTGERAAGAGGKGLAGRTISRDSGTTFDADRDSAFGPPEAGVVRV